MPEKKEEGLHRRGTALREGALSWLTDVMWSFFLNRLRTVDPEIWKTFAWHVQKNETATRAAIIGGASFIEWILDAFPILSAIQYLKDEFLEQSANSVLLYYRQHPVTFEEGYEPAIPSAGEFVSRVFEWVRDTVEEWRSDFMKVVLPILPWLERARRERDEFLLILSAVDEETFHAWVSWVSGLNGEDTGLIRTYHHALSNIEFLKRVLSIPDDQRIAFLRTHGAGIGTLWHGVMQGLSDAVDPVLDEMSANAVRKQGEHERRIAELKARREAAR